MNAIILKRGKLLDGPKATEEEEVECMVKEKGQSPLEDEVIVLPEDKEQGIHKEVPRPRVVEPYRPLVPFTQRLTKAKFEAKFWRF